MCCSKTIDLEALLEQVNKHVMDNGGVMIRYLSDRTDGRAVWLKNRSITFSSTRPIRAVTPIQAAHALTLPLGKGKLAALPLFELVEVEDSAESEPAPDVTLDLNGNAETVTPDATGATESSTNAVEVSAESDVQSAPTVESVDEMADEPEAAGEAKTLSIEDSVEKSPEEEEEAQVVALVDENAEANASVSAIELATLNDIRLSSLGIADRKITVTDVKKAIAND